jgi:Mlc titration factor MtfA (ptsG expression regulator)
MPFISLSRSTMFMWGRIFRRKRLQQQPFPAEWEAMLLRNLAHYRLLDTEERLRLQDDTKIFVAEKSWEGCRGLTVTEEMKVTIAAQACVMLLGVEHDFFSNVRTVLLYPAGFMMPPEEEWYESESVEIDGQAVPQGPVILAWDTVLAEARDLSTGHNLVIHEFAHQLDFADGYLDGTFDMAEGPGALWSSVLTAAYKQLRADLRQGRNPFLGEYAATNKTEFFAVATERFFTLPLQLRHHHPSLYELMVAGFGMDPGRWFGEARPA